MSGAGPFLRSYGSCRLGFWCPGCKSAHLVAVRSDPHPCWSYNGNEAAPTFTPSVLVTYPGADAGIDDAPPAICHTFVTDGQIQFLGDCTHELAGQTVPMVPFPEDYA